MCLITGSYFTDNFYKVQARSPVLPSSLLDFCNTHMIFPIRCSELSDSLSVFEGNINWLCLSHIRKCIVFCRSRLITVLILSINHFAVAPRYLCRRPGLSSCYML